jgi:signal transduction histidine kinase
VGLAVAVRDYVTGFSKRSSILVAVEVPEALPRRDRDIETGALRIVQESLMNVYRHSGSRRAVVRVNSHAGNLAVEVEDFGRGIPAGVLKGQVDGEAQPGVGLQGMRCRVQQLGGALQIRSNGRGTVIRAVFPSTKRD